MSKTIIESMCSISEQMRPAPDSDRMDLSRMMEASDDISALSETLELSAMQVVLLTAIMQRSARSRIAADDVALTLGLDYLKFLTMNDDLEGLRKKGYLRIDDEGSICVPKSVIDCLKTNAPVKPLPMTGLHVDELLSRIKSALEIRSQNECTTNELIDELDNLMDLNPDNSVSRTIRKILNKIKPEMGITRLEDIVLYALVYRYYFENDDRVCWGDLEDYFHHVQLDVLKINYRSESLRLQKEHIIEYADRNGVIEKSYFRIKDEYKEAIFEDVGGIQKKSAGVTSARKFSAGDIAQKELFYAPDEGRQVAELRSLLAGERFEEIRSRMKEMHLRTGFTCLFYGAPGTGKTETVYQLARDSGRDLFIIDVAQVKSCWHGESEKNITEVFDRYRSCVEAGGPVPILLFNEADAIFGVRSEGALHSADKSDNAVQNIILQGMEDLDGILIATTNLTTSLDKAFERRFLYKIRFNQPTPEIRSHIWQSMIPDLSPAQATSLATDFSFSGGQIENVVRKKTVRGLISGVQPSYDELVSYCQEENIEQSADKRKIGF